MNWSTKASLVFVYVYCIVLCTFCATFVYTLVGSFMLKVSNWVEILWIMGRHVVARKTGICSWAVFWIGNDEWTLSEKLHMVEAAQGKDPLWHCLVPPHRATRKPCVSSRLWSSKLCRRRRRRNELAQSIKLSAAVSMNQKQTKERNKNEELSVKAGTINST
jgi:hypothetical protein